MKTVNELNEMNVTELRKLAIETKLGYQHKTEKRKLRKGELVELLANYYASLAPEKVEADKLNTFQLFNYYRNKASEVLKMDRQVAKVELNNIKLHLNETSQKLQKKKQKGQYMRVINSIKCLLTVTESKLLKV